MRVQLDQDSCVGSGQCVSTVHTVFDQRDEDGIAFLLKQDVDGDEADGVEHAASVCPALAIRLQT